jgi:prephenate dehydratase
MKKIKYPTIKPIKRVTNLNPTIVIDKSVIDNSDTEIKEIVVVTSISQLFSTISNILSQEDIEYSLIPSRSTLRTVKANKVVEYDYAICPVATRKIREFMKVSKDELSDTGCEPYDMSRLKEVL